MIKKDKSGLTEEEFLKQYTADIYQHPSVAADIVIFTVADMEEENYRRLPKKELQVLLIKRGIHPFLGDWALPGGFVRPGENIKQAAQRELLEETGVNQSYLEQLYTFSDPKRDPRTWVISCSYMALLDSSKLSLQAGDDADHVAWFSVSYHLLQETREDMPEGVCKRQQYELQLTNQEERLSAIIEQKILDLKHSSDIEYCLVENQGLAFDHAKIIACAMERLRNKIEYTNIALHLMPPLFTLTELQQVYEVILDKELLKAAFRRKIAGLVTETEEFTENAGHRPSRLFRRKMQ